MDIRILHYFLIVAREENITKAAQVLHITQPTLSRQLIQLEEELGVTLFQRGKHTITLTKEGMLFRRRAQEILDIAEKAKTELGKAAQSLHGRITIGCNESQSINELSKLISAFRKTYPLVTFELRSGNNVDIQDWIDHGIVDFGVLVEPVEVEHYSYLRFRHKDVWGILVHEASALAQKTGIRAMDLLNVPLITVADERIHTELASWSGKQADKMFPIVHYNLLSNAAPLVRQQEGVAVCAAPNCEYPLLTFVPFEPALTLGSLLAWKNRQVASEESAVFIQFIKDMYKQN